ncbi:hypothetical protein [Solirubrobacter pauli]|uniref:hypothetical protein n=1 Tax=Solirubrobacter pauli TaxID=166793 RepID=UPI001476AA84|nr:hypothetical protein [Solirubrobacter pauli]
MEQDDRVVVEVRDDLCLPRSYSAPFQVLGPDLVPVQYKPSDPQYYDQVLMDLSRGFIIGKEGRVSKATNGVILGLLAKHIWPLLRKEHVGVYHEKARTYPAVAAYQKANYGCAPEPARTGEKPARTTVRAGTGSYVAA